MFFRLGFLTLILLLFSACESPPAESANELSRGILSISFVKVTTSKVGDFVEVIITGAAKYSDRGMFPEKNTTVTIGAVLTLSSGTACTQLPQATLPDSIHLADGNSLSEQMILVFKPGELRKFSHTFRFTSNIAQKVYIAGGLWGKPNNLSAPGDWEDLAFGLISCADPGGFVGDKPQVVIFQ